MASKWEYSSLPAQDRLDMIRGGNKDVYDSEIARSLDVINSRKELGLDIAEQKNWIDNISYNYNLHNAENMGIESSRVNKTGYADLLLGTKTTADYAPKKKRTKFSNNQAAFEEAAANLLSEYYQKVNEAAQGINAVKEWLVNNGIEESSVDGQKYIKDFEEELAQKTQKYNNEYASKVKALVSGL